jgi:hypothetical protein
MNMNINYLAAIVLMAIVTTRVERQTQWIAGFWDRVNRLHKIKRKPFQLTVNMVIFFLILAITSFGIEFLFFIFLDMQEPFISFIRGGYLGIIFVTLPVSNLGRKLPGR